MTLCPPPTSDPQQLCQDPGGHWVPAGLQSTAAHSPSSGQAKHRKVEDGRVKKQEKISSSFENKSYRLGKRLEIQSGPNHSHLGRRTSGSLGREDLTPPPASVDEPHRAGASLLLLPLLHRLPGTGGVTSEPPPPHRTGQGRLAGGLEGVSGEGNPAGSSLSHPSRVTSPPRSGGRARGPGSCGGGAVRASGDEAAGAQVMGTRRPPGTRGCVLI